MSGPERMVVSGTGKPRLEDVRVLLNGITAPTGATVAMDVEPWGRAGDSRWTLTVEWPGR